MLKLLNIEEVSDLIDRHPNSIRKMAKDCDFPQSVNLFGRRPAIGSTHFIETEVLRWIAKRLARDAEDRSRGIKRRGRPAGIKFPDGYRKRRVKTISLPSGEIVETALRK